MSANILVVVGFADENTLVPNIVTNHWAFTNEAGTALELADAALYGLEFFYNQAYTFGAVCNFLSKQLSRFEGASTFTVYDLGTPPLPGPGEGIGSPILERTWKLGDGFFGAGVGPAQISAVLSFHGDLTGVPGRSGDTRPAARRYGRLFIGPLRSDFFTYAGGNVVFNSTLVDVIAQAADAMGGDFGFPGPWAVYSRTDRVMYPVVGGFVDDRPDVQRRRAGASLVRVAFPLPPLGGGGGEF